MYWWLEKPMRMVQTNLREIDIDLDVDLFIEQLKAFSANVLLFNVGGIVANYPSDLEFHFRTPNLTHDFVGEVIKRTQAEGIRFIARFDFSKLNELYANEHPEWLYTSIKGEHINYNGQVHTCINAYYQQEYSLKILEEVIDRYPIDGVFFNMFGYVTSDYSGNVHGICHCESCQRRFLEYSGHALPAKEDGNDPIYLQYQAFQEETVGELLQRISRFVKSKNEQIANCTYTADWVDIYRKESNTGIDRPGPEWNYSAAENVKSVLNAWDNKVVSNSAVHFIDYPCRHSGVSPELTLLRIAENIANAGWLDYYVISSLERQDDRVCFEGVKELFSYYKTHERYYTGVQSVADVCLIQSEKNVVFGSEQEFRGLFRLLAESQTLFGVLPDTVLEEPGAAERLRSYQIVLLPDTRILPLSVLELLDGYVSGGGKLLSTGLSASCDPENGQDTGKILLRSSGISQMNAPIESKRGSYLRIREQDKSTLQGFADLDILPLDGDMLNCPVPENGAGYLGYIPPYMFGPPEKCYYKEETDIPGLIENSYGKGKCITIPWKIGRHYDRLGHHGHSMLFRSALRELAEFRPSVVPAC